MNYEEKYNDLLSRIKRMADVQPDVTRVAIESLFPELKESEDERIRKALTDYFVRRKSEGDTDETWYGIPYDTIIAWLEKQGQHKKFRDSIQVGDKVTRNEDGILVNLSQLNRVAKKQGEQKPAWSEEDGAMLDNIVAWIEGKWGTLGGKVGGREAYISFLKSLKNRVQPQPKQEWSEEDEEMCAKTLFALAGFMGNEDKIDWLKSLKERYAWKPSDGQMNDK